MKKGVVIGIVVGIIVIFAGLIIITQFMPKEEEEEGGINSSSSFSEKELCTEDKEYLTRELPDKLVLSLPFDAEDYSTEYWGFIPFCAELKSGSTHTAIDFELKPDSKIYASESGVVGYTHVGEEEGTGEVIGIEGDGFDLDYAGLTNSQVKVGDEVKKGDYLGDAVLIPHGEYHVHLGILINGKHECPLKYMDDEFKEEFKQMFAQSEYSTQTLAPCACNCESMEAWQ